MTPSWRPTHSLVRAGLGSLTLAVAAVVLGRPDLLVLGVPLLVLAAGGALARPDLRPSAETALVHGSVREGEGTTVRATLHDAGSVEHAVLALAPHRYTAYQPPSGVRGTTVAAGTALVRVGVPVAGLRWGGRPVGDGRLAATSPWAGYRWGPVDTPPQTLSTLPAAGTFDVDAPVPHPIGLVGTNPARRTGDGSEFASIRPFQPGDRLKRVQWRVSLRTGALHVTSTQSEEDSSVLLLVDAMADVGDSGGIRGPSSSLDVAVRAAAAVGEHYLHKGDRVGMRVLGTSKRGMVPMGAGKRHLRRLLDTLARIVPGQDPRTDPVRSNFRVPAGAVVLVLSPMLSEHAVSTTVTLARRGLSVIVVDTLPEDIDRRDDDERLRLAWRLRLLERAALLRNVEIAGIPVVAWRGPGTLDEVLRRLGRRARPPRMVRR